MSAKRLGNNRQIPVDDSSADEDLMIHESDLEEPNVEKRTKCGSQALKGKGDSGKQSKKTKNNA